eukprot:1156607-Pelagomonas_calceolata.AAC.11
MQAASDDAGMAKERPTADVSTFKAAPRHGLARACGTATIKETTSHTHQCSLGGSEHIPPHQQQGFGGGRSTVAGQQGLRVRIGRSTVVRICCQNRDGNEVQAHSIAHPSPR